MWDSLRLAQLLLLFYFSAQIIRTSRNLRSCMTSLSRELLSHAKNRVIFFHLYLDLTGLDLTTLHRHFLTCCVLSWPYKATDFLINNFLVLLRQLADQRKQEKERRFFGPKPLHSRYTSWQVVWLAGFGNRMVLSSVMSYRLPFFTSLMYGFTGLFWIIPIGRYASAIATDAQVFITESPVSMTALFDTNAQFHCAGSGNYLVWEVDGTPYYHPNIVIRGLTATTNKSSGTVQSNLTVPATSENNGTTVRCAIGVSQFIFTAFSNYSTLTVLPGEWAKLNVHFCVSFGDWPVCTHYA